ncbi:hypothetical protein GB937_004965 [Aspergillus fischeri]|nr:hypothetical protein GB937_004965 [Aspergillus fischeri]
MSVGNSLTLTSAQELIQFANTTGRKKVMFGTNFAQLSWSKCAQSANRDIRLRDDVKAHLLCGNAARVLKLGTVALGKEKL